jgi:pyruvate formate lyase activating enzyme
MEKGLHPAILCHKENDKIRCDLCARKCLIPEGKRGFCMVRENMKGKLYSLNYGKIVGLNVDPIEKKPLFHFFPGSFSLSYACRGCNWRCSYCCNWSISHDGLPKIFGTDYTPEQIVQMAVKDNLKIISHTYTEPTIYLEFAHDVAKLAHKNKIKNTFVTNGYMTSEALRKISKFLDAATVDFKASGNEEFLRNFASVPTSEPIFETLKGMKKLGVHTEITDLIVPKVGDKIEDLRKLVKWIVDELGPETPFHLIRFFPTYKMIDIPETPVETLEKFVKEARKLGLNYVYLGNVPGHENENTYCPNCKELLVERIGFESRIINLEKDRCRKCGEKIYLYPL